MVNVVNVVNTMWPYLFATVGHLCGLILFIVQCEISLGTICAGLRKSSMFDGIDSNSRL